MTVSPTIPTGTHDASDNSTIASMTFRHSCHQPAPGGGHHRPHRRPECDGALLGSVTATGSDVEFRPTIVGSEWVRGERRSTIRRPDGSTFTVTVPPIGMDECTDGVHWPHGWITGGREPHAPSGLLQLHRAVVVELHETPPLDMVVAEQEPLYER
jgi:hypothetical protein